MAVTQCVGSITQCYRNSITAILILSTESVCAILCASKAVSVLPRNVEYMVSQTYSWFSNATQRLQRYSELYKTINVGESPLKIQQLSDTRWLSISECVHHIFSQYEELKLHFQLIKKTVREAMLQNCCTKCTATISA